MDTEGFWKYFAAQGETDMEYYLEYMASLSENPDVDLTAPDAFAGLNKKDGED